MRTIVVFINGHPRSGKDTVAITAKKLVEDVSVHPNERHGRVENISTIDPIVRAVNILNLDISRKTPEDRALLSEIGDALEKYDGRKSRHVVMAVRLVAADLLYPENGIALVFVHVREAVMVDKIKTMLPDGVETIALLVESTRAEHVDSNAADNGVYSWEYNHVIGNHGTLEELRESVSRFLKEINVPTIALNQKST